MKKTLIFWLKNLLPLVCLVFTLSGCRELLEAAVLVGEVAKPFEESARNDREARERAREFGKGGDIPFTNRAEDRLTRRTSNLAGGIPVDISPYLFNVNSFALTENGIKYFDSIIEITYVYQEKDKDNDFRVPVYEYDITVTFEADKKKYQMNKTIAACKSTKDSDKDRIKKYMKGYAAAEYGLDPKNIKNFNVKYLKTRKGQSKINFLFNNIFIQDIEPGYFQFDAEVEYQNSPTYIMKIKRKIAAKDIAVFNKVYRSDFTIMAAAAIDVQGAIWEDACDKGSNDTPLPIVNFVKSARFTR